MKSKRGFAPIIIVIVIVAVLGVGFLLFGNSKRSEEVEENYLAGVYDDYGDHIDENKQESADLDSDTLVISQAVSATSKDAEVDPATPSTLPDEFTYKGAYLVSYEQVANMGLSLVYLTPDSKVQIFAVLKKQLVAAGWDAAEESGEALIFKKNEQSAKVKVVEDQNFNLIITAVTFGSSE